MTQKSPPLNTSLGFGMTAGAKSAKRRKDPAERPERRARIMLVDSDADSRRLMTARLSTLYQIDTVDTAEAALDACVRSRPNLVITDLRLDAMDGLALLKELKSRWPAIAVIIVTAHGTIPEAVQATQCGAFGFLVKPVEKAELLGQVARGIESSSFTLVEGNWRSEIVARSQLMEDRLSLANRAAASEAPVLLTGENGTGKELLARAIHAASARRDHLFVTVRCKDASEEALDRELFADGGAIEAARGGTLLLDEVGHLTLRLQVELLGALRGAASAKIIATTSRDLKSMMESGEFRHDLFYFLNVLPIEIPPLGRRREDIPLLVSHFLEQATDVGGTRKIYTPEAIELLATTDWPGNVRQLFDLVKQNVALSHSKIMSKEFVERSLGGAAKKVPTYDEARDNFARDYLASNLQATAGNISQAARLAKRNRTDFYKLLARYRVEPNDFKSDAPGSLKKPRSKD